MKNTILKWIYRRYTNKFNDFLVDDFVKEMPVEMKHEMESLFESQKQKLMRTNNFLAYQLHRRMATDSKNSERYQGMFIQLKIFDAALKSKPDVKPKTPAQVEEKKGTFDYNKTIDEAIKKGKQSNAQQ